MSGIARTLLASACAVYLLEACGTATVVRSVARKLDTSPRVSTPAPAPVNGGVAGERSPVEKPLASLAKQGGGFYQDDGPGDNVPENVDSIPDAVPRNEPLHRFANNPYSVLGREYVPMRRIEPLRMRGIGSWYGRKFHGQRTSSGETYDMYGMTAAHPTLPIPSYVRVSNPANGRSLVVRVNDRGPFHAGRMIDLSWTAAYKLGYVNQGSTLVDIQLVVPGEEPPVIVANKPEEDPILQFATQPEPVSAPLPESRDASGHYVQLGAFGSRDNAEALRTRLARELGELGGKLVIRPAGKLFKVQLGPWPDSPSARRAGEQLRESFGMAPVVVQG